MSARIIRVAGPVAILVFLLQSVAYLGRDIC